MDLFIFYASFLPANNERTMCYWGLAEIRLMPEYMIKLYISGIKLPLFFPGIFCTCLRIGPPKGGGGPILYAIWLFYWFAICYNKKFNTAIIHFQLLL